MLSAEAVDGRDREGHGATHPRARPCQCRAQRVGARLSSASLSGRGSPMAVSTASARRSSTATSPTRRATDASCRCPSVPQPRSSPCARFVPGSRRWHHRGHRLLRRRPPSPVALILERTSVHRPLAASHIRPRRHRGLRPGDPPVRDCSAWWSGSKSSAPRSAGHPRAADGWRSGSSRWPR